MTRPAGLLALALALIAVAGPRPARAQVVAQTWVVDQQGRRFRVRFDPGERLFAGVAAAAGAAGLAHPDPTLELGLSLRAAPPPANAEVFWKRDHQIVHTRLAPQAGGLALEGRLYRGVFLRHSREGSLTIPTTPPLRLALPFDVGVRVEVGRFARQPGSGVVGVLDVEVVRGEALIDFLRSERPGRWLGVGWLGSYDVRLQRVAGEPRRDHRVTPMTALGASGRTETEGGLWAAGFRVEGGRAWSTAAGWHGVARAEVELEVTPLAINDLPLSLAIAGSFETDARAHLRAGPARLLAGLRLGAPLRD